MTVTCTRQHHCNDCGKLLDGTLCGPCETAVDDWASTFRYSIVHKETGVSEGVYQTQFEAVTELQEMYLDLGDEAKSYLIKEITS